VLQARPTLLEAGQTLHDAVEHDRALIIRVPMLRIIVPLLLAASCVTLECPRLAFGQSGVCPGSSMPLDTSARWRPFVKMRLGNREGYFVLDTGATHSSVDAKTFGRPAGSKLAITGSTFPLLRGGDFGVIDFGDAPAPGGHMAGLIGDDTLARQTVEMHYDASSPYVVGVATMSRSHVRECGLRLDIPTWPLFFESQSTSPQ
jgi:hypothetical protein